VGKGLEVFCIVGVRVAGKDAVAAIVGVALACKTPFSAWSRLAEQAEGKRRMAMDSRITRKRQESPLPPLPRGARNLFAPLGTPLRVRRRARGGRGDSFNCLFFIPQIFIYSMAALIIAKIRSKPARANRQFS
jgi:hypothetical protein